MALKAVHEAAAKRVDADAGYAGAVTPEEAWRLLKDDPAAVLIDVRTQPEWVLVGVPDLHDVGKATAFVSWQTFPAMNENPNFDAELASRNVTPDQTALFICRSGNRSAGAAKAMTAKGFTRCYNVLEGFEGTLDDARHRGSLNGWKAKGLPWVQG
jgi:rhodanese-related sulfurtransferase